eukprot:803047-Alexandrium_andersonii.AAC.1
MQPRRPRRGDAATPRPLHWRSCAAQPRESSHTAPTGTMQQRSHQDVPRKCPACSARSPPRAAHPTATLPLGGQGPGSV